MESSLITSRKDANYPYQLYVKSILDAMNISYELEGNEQKTVSGVASITDASLVDLSFCSCDGAKAVELISQSNAGIILCKKSLRGMVHPKQDMQLIFLDKPRLVFVNLVNKTFTKKKLVGISPKAVISETAKIGDQCYIGDYTVIGENCEIGNDVIIYDKVTLVENCIIGSRCIIHSGVTLGDDGFAFERDERELYRFPHFGRLVIGDDVEICANSHVARGSLSDTTIGNGSKIDSLVHISHNVTLGKNCEITAGAVIGGSAIVGDSTWIGLNATLKDHVTVGNNVIVASGASVIHDVPSQDIVAGVPAKSIKHKISAESDALFLMAGLQATEQISPSE
ncbi:MAG TPA: DapH/DapD/GlmU-related protein [Candidatus Nitrosotalea sp.]|nr:DapH/DapD/GlmU-related protein [Candidatus Nitrosotalea sp.]